MHPTQGSQLFCCSEQEFALKQQSAWLGGPSGGSWVPRSRLQACLHLSCEDSAYLVHGERKGCKLCLQRTCSMPTHMFCTTGCKTRLQVRVSRQVLR